MVTLREFTEKIFRFAIIVGLFEGGVMDLVHLLNGMRPLADKIVEGLEVEVPLEEPVYQLGVAKRKLAEGIYAMAEVNVEGKKPFFRIKIGFDDQEIDEALTKRNPAFFLLKDFVAFENSIRVLWLIMRLDEVMKNLEDMVEDMPELKDAEDVKKILKNFVGTLAMLKECLKE